MSLTKQNYCIQIIIQTINNIAFINVKLNKWIKQNKTDVLLMHEFWINKIGKKIK